MNGDEYRLLSPLVEDTSDLAVPSLSDVRDALRNRMAESFREVNVDIVSCPCLTREPFNLAAVGLSGNPAIMEIGNLSTFIPSPRQDAYWNIRQRLAFTCKDSFIIGAGYATAAHMRFNGHLIMNAMYRAPTIITNASRIIFADAGNGQRRMEMLTQPNQMTCSYMGNFFVSEGREGLVLRVSAKGRTSTSDIITIMQDALYAQYYESRQELVALGGVLKVRNGRVAQNIMPEQYPQRVESFVDLARWFECHEMALEKDLVAVGTISSDVSEKMSETTEVRYGIQLRNRHHQFHSYSICEQNPACGQFVSDITPELTEYEGYFNVAEKRIRLE